jgi:hypothetical protein
MTDLLGQYESRSVTAFHRCHSPNLKIRMASQLNRFIHFGRLRKTFFEIAGMADDTP